MDMNQQQISENIVSKMLSEEGHIASAKKGLAQLKGNAKFAMITVMLPKFRLSYPALAQPKDREWKGEKLDPAYSIQAIFGPEEQKGLWPFWRVVTAVSQRFNGKASPAFMLNVANGATLIKDNESFIEGQKEKGRDTEGLQEIYMKGGSYINLSRNATKGAVKLIGMDKQMVPQDKITEVFYPGCYCVATVEVFPAPSNDKVFARLQAIMKVEEGEKLGAGNSFSLDDFNEVNVVANNPEVDALFATGDNPFQV